MIHPFPIAIAFRSKRQEGRALGDGVERSEAEAMETRNRSALGKKSASICRGEGLRGRR